MGMVNLGEFRQTHPVNEGGSDGYSMLLVLYRTIEVSRQQVLSGKYSQGLKYIVL